LSEKYWIALSRLPWSRFVARGVLSGLMLATLLGGYQFWAKQEYLLQKFPRLESNLIFLSGLGRDDAGGLDACLARASARGEGLDRNHYVGVLLRGLGIGCGPASAATAAGFTAGRLGGKGVAEARLKVKRTAPAYCRTLRTVLDYTALFNLGNSMNRLLGLLAVLFSAPLFAQQIDEVALKANNVVTRPSHESFRNLVNYTTNNSTGQDYARAFADGTCCSGLGPVKWVAQAFSVSANDSCDISSIQAGFDGYIFVYQDPFDPADPTSNFVAGDDDGDGGIGTSDIQGLGLNSGVTYQLISTGFANGDEGEFNNSISCPTAIVSLAAAGPPAPIPANFNWALLLLASGLIGFALLRLRNSN
jgi:hypothetical protein